MNQGRLPIILGSSSKWRRRMIEEWGYAVVCFLSPDIDEKAIGEQLRAEDGEENAQRLVCEISLAKMGVVLEMLSDREEPLPMECIVVTSDQVIVCDGKIREKPRDEAECDQYLTSYSEGKPAECIVGMCFAHLVNGVPRSDPEAHVDVASQYFKEINADARKALIEKHKDDLLSCAGGFCIEHMGEFDQRLDGDIETVMGFSKRLLEDFVKKANENEE